MKLYFILPLLLCFCSQISSQAYLKTLFEVEWRDKIEDFVNVNDTIVICSNITQHPDDFLRTSAFITIDSSGNVLDYHQNESNDSTFYYKFLRTNLLAENGGFVGSFGNGPGQTFILKFDHSFNIVDRGHIPVDSNQGTTFMVEPYLDGYMVAGTQSYIDGSTDNIVTNIQYVRLDAELDILWNKKIAQAGMSEIRTHQDSTFTLITATRDNGGGLQYTLMNFDSLGNEVSRLSAVNEAFFQVAQSVHELENGNYVFISNKLNPTPEYLPLLQKTIRCIDQEGNMLWTTSVGKEFYNNGFVEMVCTQDGNFVATGLNKPSIGELPEDAYWTNEFQVVKIDAEGKVLWTTQDTIIYNPEFDTDTVIKGITELSSGSIVVLGYTWYTKGFERVASSWMAKYDKDGCKIHGCRPLTSRTELIDRAELSVYPNPTSDFLQIDTKASFTSVAVYDLAGKCVIRMPYSSSIDIQAMPSGIYVLELVGETGVYRTKIVKS